MGIVRFCAQVVATLWQALLRCFGAGTTDFSRLLFSGREVEHVAVLIQRNLPFCNTHTGIAYRNVDEQLRFLHFAWHEQLRDDEGESVGGRAFAVPKLLPDDAEYLAGFCARVWRANMARKIPYSLQYDPDVRFDLGTGRWVTSDRGTGFTCSTFVVVIFRSSGNPLVEVDSWPKKATPEDRKVQATLVGQLKKSKKPSERERGMRIESEIGCRRISPEQTAGACLESKLPARYRRCNANGLAILKRLDQHFGPPTKQ